MSGTRQGGLISGLIFGSVFALIGYFVAFTFGKPILDSAKASRDWPSVPGAVTRSEVITDRSGKNSKTMYSFDVVYRYEVEGSEYTCNNVFFGGNSSSSNSGAAYKVSKRYPERAQVQVFYEPNNPANAVLEPGTHWQSYIVFGIGLLFLVIGVLVGGGSLLYLLAATAIIGGAIAVWLGKSSQAEANPVYAPPRRPSRETPPDETPRDDTRGDGFDIR